MFEREQERNGKIQVPVLFTLNGRKVKIRTRDGEDNEIYMDSDKPLYPYIGMNDGCSVVTKVRTGPLGCVFSQFTSAPQCHAFYFGRV